MQRYFMTIAYKGTPFHGWQIQPQVNTVQGCIEKALAHLGHTVKITGSSRTDQGVHAQGQIAHVDLPNQVNTIHLQRSLNALLGSHIVIRTIKPVQEEAHARYTATSRTYRYHITNLQDPFLTGTTYCWRGNLSWSTMNSVAQQLLGKHDFTSFCKKGSPSPHYECTIHQAFWKQEKNYYLFFITANRFLYGMVRALTGTLLEIGKGKKDPSSLQKLLKTRDRKAVQTNVPSHGLTLMQVNYPDTIWL